jgi:hypothetical protein
MIMNWAGYGRGRRALDMRMKADIPDLIPRGAGPYGGRRQCRTAAAASCGRLAILSRTAIRDSPPAAKMPNII